MARVSAGVRARAAELRVERGWSGPYALRQASAEARGLTRAQGRGVHAEPQFRRILGARAQGTLDAGATGAIRLSGQVVDPTGTNPRYVVTLVTSTGEEKVFTYSVRQRDAVIARLDALRAQGLPVPPMLDTP